MPGGANTLKTLRAAVTTTLATVSSLQVYDHEPRELDYPLPAAVLGIPRLERAGLDQAEDELARTTWKAFYPLVIAISHDDPAEGQDDAVGILGQVIGAFDNDPTLGNSAGVIDAMVIDAQPGFTPSDAQRQLVVYSCTVGVQMEVS